MSSRSKIEMDDPVVGVDLKGVADPVSISQQTELSEQARPRASKSSQNMKQPQGWGGAQESATPKKISLFREKSHIPSFKHGPYFQASREVVGFNEVTGAAGVCVWCAWCVCSSLHNAARCLSSQRATRMCWCNVILSGRKREREKEKVSSKVCFAGREAPADWVSQPERGSQNHRVGRSVSQSSGRKSKQQVVKGETLRAPARTHLNVPLPLLAELHWTCRPVRFSSQVQTGNGNVFFFIVHPEKAGNLRHCPFTLQL